MSSGEAIRKAKVRYIIIGRRSFKENRVKKQRVRLSILAATTMTLCGVIGSGTSGLAQSEGASIRQFDDGFCSNGTLRGKYAFIIEGLFVDAPVPLPLRGVAMTHFDGRGNLSQVD